MNVKVKYFNLFQEALGKREEIYNLEQDANLIQLIKKIIERNGAKAAQLLYKDAEAIAPYIRFFVDNKLIYDHATILHDGAEVAIFYAVVGG